MKRLIKNIHYLQLIILLSCNFQQGKEIKSSSEIEIIDNLSNKVDQEINYDSIIDEKVRNYKIFQDSPLARVIPEIGDRYIDLKAVNKVGDEIRLSDIDGKFILLNFTTSYCGACKRSVPELKVINNKYQESLAIVSFYTDTYKKDWLESIKRDSTTWISLWDGQGTYSINCYNYGITGYPTFILINPKGIIIDKWIGYAYNSLEDKLQAIIKN